MGAATRRIQVGTWITNIYVRHSYACAQGAALIADATHGRFVLGLGVSHPPVNQALGIDMGDAPSALREAARANLGLYTTFPFRRSATGSWMPCV